MNYWEEDHRGKMSFSSHHMKCTYNQHDFNLFLLVFVMLTSPQNALSLPFYLFHTVHFGMKLDYAANI